MRISVIIPIFNSEKTIEKALQSILQQTYPADWEIICVNDGSTDHTLMILENFQKKYNAIDVKIISQNNRGVASARNAGLRMATGEMIAFLDADDVWMKDKTMLQMKALDENELDFIACKKNEKPMLFPYNFIKNGIAKVTFRKLLFRNEIQPSTVILKSSFLLNVGYFTEGQRYAEDVYYWMKISKLGKMGILNENHVFLGEGKRSFGVSGLSGNLKMMDEGFRSNLLKIEQLGYINSWERVCYDLFYRMKYQILLLRQ